jgi:ABC-type multidrug transport system ATPase subunit
MSKFNREKEEFHKEAGSWDDMSALQPNPVNILQNSKSGNKTTKFPGETEFVEHKHTDSCSVSSRSSSHSATNSPSFPSSAVHLTDRIVPSLTDLPSIYDLLPETPRLLLRWENLHQFIPLKSSSAYRWSDPLNILKEFIRPDSMEFLSNQYETKQNRVHIEGNSQVNIHINSELKEDFAQSFIPPLHHIPILKGLSGYLTPGEVTGLIGHTACGKSSLLSILAGRDRDVERNFGLITINGKPFEASDQHWISYISPAYRFNEVATVYDYLMEKIKFHQLIPSNSFSSSRSSASSLFSYSPQAILLWSLLKEFYFTSIAHQPICLLSQGQRGLLSYLSEMLSPTSIYLIDQLDSVLDSSTFSLVFQSFLRLSFMGKSILCGFQHCNYRSFYSLNRCQFMLFGQLVMFGTPQGIVDYAAWMGFPCPLSSHPVEYLLDCLANPTWGQFLLKSYQQAPVHCPSDLVEKYHQYPWNWSYIPHSSALSSSPAPFSSSWSHQFYYLLARNWKQQSQELLSRRILLFQFFFIIFLISLVWWRLDFNEANIFDRYSCAFFTLNYFSFQFLYDSLLILPSERSIIQQERQSGFYSLSAYYLARIVSFLGGKLIYPTFIVIVVYYTVGIWDNSFVCWIGYIFTHWCCWTATMSLGFFLGSLANRVTDVVVLASMLVSALMMLTGFYVHLLSSWLSWTKFLSFFKYGMDSLMSLEYPDDRQLSCSTAYLLEPCYPINVVETSSSPTTSGSAVRSYFDVTLNPAVSMLILLLTSLVLLSFGFASLRFYERRRAKEWAAGFM